jgi:mannosyltransferase
MSRSGAPVTSGLVISTRAQPARRLAVAVTPRAAYLSALAAVLAAAALVVVPGLGAESFWRDETWSVTIAHRSLGGTLDVLTNREANMAPYYLLLNGWLRLGTGEAFARVPSVVFALLAIAATAAVVRRGTGRTLPAVVAAAALAANGFFLTYAQEARDYTLVAALAALSTLALVRAVDIDRRRDWVLYVAAATLLVYAHVLAGLIVVAQLGSLALLPTVPRRRAVSAGLAVGLLCLPLVGFVVLRDKGQSSWVPPLSWSVLGDAADTAFGNVPLLAAYLALAAVVLADTLRAGRSRETWFRALVLSWALIPPIALAAISFAKPLFVDRYLIGSVAGLACLAAVAAASPHRARAAIVVTAALALSVVHVARMPWPYPKPDNPRSAAHLVERHARPGDGIAYATGWARVATGYYLGGRLPDLSLAPGGSALAVGDVVGREAPLPVVEHRMLAGRRFWLVDYPTSPWHIGPEPVHAALASVVGRRFRAVHAWKFGDLVVTLYVRRA